MSFRNLYKVDEKGNIYWLDFKGDRVMMAPAPKGTLDEKKR